MAIDSSPPNHDSDPQKTAATAFQEAQTGSRPPTLASTILPGGRVGVYEILGFLGAGGMGAVYRARDPRLGRNVAIKVLPQAFVTDRSRCARLRREARLVAALNHPNIAAIYGLEECDGVPALVLELVEGETLAERLARQRVLTRDGLPLNEALALAREIGLGVEAAHSKGIVHRDLKPANIKITTEGRAKILDFGLAKALADDEGGDADSARTQTGVLLGTASYMSPEQVRGAADRQADIWAFGCVLYEMLTGQQAFPAQASPADTLAQVLDAEPRWDALPVRTPSAVLRLLRCCLQKNPARRPRDIGEALRELDQVTASKHRGARPRSASRGPGGRLTRRTIAILPFASATPGAVAEYLGRGISESIANGLSQLPTLKVIAPRTFSRHLTSGSDPAVVARELQVRTIVAGDILQLGQRLIVRAELIEAAQGMRLWGEQYERPLDDVLVIQQDIAARIVESLQLRLTPEQKKQLAKRPTTSTTAYQYYLRGRYHWSRRTAADFARAIECFESAIASDPAYALAYVGLADCYAVLPFYDVGPPMRFFHRAKAAAIKALELDDLLQEAHTALGHIQLYYEWDWRAAEMELLRGIALAPSSAEAHHVYGYFLSAVGRSLEAIEQFRRSLECDPLSLSINASLGVMLYFRKRYSEAIEQLSKTLQLDEDYAPAHAFLAWAHAAAGDGETAITEARQGLVSMDAPWVLVSLGHALAVAGRRDEAQQVLSEVLARAERQYVSPYDLAVLYGWLGQWDRAMEALEAAYEERSGILVWGVLNDPRLDPVRSRPAFQALVSRMGLAPPAAC